MAGVIAMVTNAFTYPIAWFTYVFKTSGMLSFFLVFFFVFQVTRLILFPLLGRAGRSVGSDKVNSHAKSRFK